MLESDVLDTLIPSSAELAGDPALVSRAEALRPIVEAAADEIEDQRRLPPALLDKLHEARLFRLLLPRSFDGFETDPVTFFGFDIQEPWKSAPAIDAFMKTLQPRITGSVRLKLFKGDCRIVGRRSPLALPTSNLQASTSEPVTH